MWIYLSGKYKEERNENPTNFSSWETCNFSYEVVTQLTKQLNFVSWSDEAAVQREMGKFCDVGTYDYFSKKKKIKRKEGICADGNLFESRGLEHDSATKSTNFWTCSYLS